MLHNTSYMPGEEIASHLQYYPNTEGCNVQNNSIDAG